jgi:leucyl aminopeptidase
MANASPKQQLPNKSSADKHSRASNNIAKPVNLTNSLSVPLATRQQPARLAKSDKSDTSDKAKLIVLTNNEVKIRKKRELLILSVAACSER